MREAYIVEALRTPLGKGRKDGAFAEIHPVDLATIVVKEVISRNNLHSSAIEDLIFGCATPTGEQGFNVARTIARKALGVEVPGTQVNRLCGSGAEAVDIASSKIKSNSYDLLIAGGVESMSRVPMGSDMLPFPGELSNIWKILTMGPKVINETLPKDSAVNSMGISGELIAEKYGFTRKELDEFSYDSHVKAANATEKGYFEKEIVRVETSKGVIKKDEGIRKSSSVEKMGTLPSAFKKDGLITAANSSQITDGAAALLLASDEAIKKYNIKPRAKILASAVVGTDVELQLTGPITVIPKVLNKIGLKISDIDLFEINEAFASVVLATIKELDLPKEKVNVNGGAIALGHPLGVSGARLLVTLLHELERRNLKRGLVSLCIGGGQGIAIVIERV
jgi:acetyl-CoA C-acetyltransferase